jgi:hypothetical protein
MTGKGLYGRFLLRCVAACFQARIPLKRKVITMRHSLRVAVLAAFAIGVAAPAANAAETFTFTSTVKSNDVAMSTAPGAKPVFGGTADVTSKTTFADGKVLQSSGKCANWSAPPGSIFDTTGSCALGDASGELYTVQFSCATDAAKAPEANCWALLIGTGGAWKGKTGMATYRTDASSAHGVGMWN